MQPTAGDQIGGSRVLGHVERVLVAHVDNRRADFDTAGPCTDGSQQGKGRSQLTREVMDPEIGPVRSKFFCRDGELYGLQQGIRG